MNNKKIIGIIIILVMVFIVVIAIVLMRTRTDTVSPLTPPPPAQGSDNLEFSASNDKWRLYQSDSGKYGISLPHDWFIDQDTLITGGSQLIVSNTEVLDENIPGIVAVEIYPSLTKKSNENLFTAIKARGKSNGDFGETRAGVTSNGYELYVVEHAFGSPLDGPGYAIARNKTEYMYIAATSNAEEDVVNGMVTSVVFFK